jgi:hypothetical protein
MNSFIRKGQYVKEGDTKRLVYMTSFEDQTSISFKMYAADSANPKYVDEDGVELLGEWNVPLTGEGLKRKIEIKICYGETELVVESRQVGEDDDKWVQRTFEFLSDLK